MVLFRDPAHLFTHQKANDLSDVFYPTFVLADEESHEIRDVLRLTHTPQRYHVDCLAPCRIGGLVDLLLVGVLHIISDYLGPVSAQPLGECTPIP
jgi:hypothetical protein